MIEPLLTIVYQRVPAISTVVSPPPGPQVLSDPRSRAEYDAELRCRGVDAGDRGAQRLKRWGYMGHPCVS